MDIQYGVPHNIEPRAYLRFYQTADWVWALLPPSACVWIIPGTVNDDGMMADDINSKMLRRH